MNTYFAMVAQILKILINKYKSTFTIFLLFGENEPENVSEYNPNCINSNKCMSLFKDFLLVAQILKILPFTIFLLFGENEPENVSEYNPRLVFLFLLE